MENISKKKKGRPEKILNEVKEMLKASARANDPKTSERTINNNYYVMLGMEILREDGYEYIVDSHKQTIYKQTIMQHIGRIKELYGIEPALELARTICKEKMNTAKAIQYIKEYRMTEGNEPLQKNKVNGVLKKIVNIINNSGLTANEMKELIERVNEINIIE